MRMNRKNRPGPHAGLPRLESKGACGCQCWPRRPPANAASEAAEPLDLGSAMVTLEASIGTANILAGDSVDDVMRRADRNMYAAKAER